MTDAQPNILWICSDQQRYDTLGCTGNPFVHTPNIDRLAQKGILFERAYCQSPICTPSRASFLTGRYPRTTRCRQNSQVIPSDEVLVTKLLADAGYNCGLSGKLHLSPAYPFAQNTSEIRTDDGYQEFHWSHMSGPESPANQYGQWLREKGVSFEVQNYSESGRVQRGMPAKNIIKPHGVPIKPSNSSKPMPNMKRNPGFSRSISSILMPHLTHPMLIWNAISIIWMRFHCRNMNVVNLTTSLLFKGVRIEGKIGGSESSHGMTFQKKNTD